MTDQQPQQTQHKGILHKLFGPYTDYVKSIAPIFYLCCLLFIFSLGMGYVLGSTLQGSVLQDLMGSFPDIKNMNILEIFAYILVNNTAKSLLFMFGGLLGGILPLFFVVFNGFIVGWVAYSLGSTNGLVYVVAGLTPHGIIEIPTTLLAMAMGMRLGFELLNKLRGSGNVWKEVKNALGLFITRVFPLLLLAAVIETTITPLILILLGYA